MNQQSARRRGSSTQVPTPWYDGRRMDSSATPSSPVIIAAAKFYDADIDHLALMIGRYLLTWVWLLWLELRGRMLMTIYIFGLDFTL